MKKERFFKMAILGILSTMIFGSTTYVSAASGYAFSAGYTGSDLDTTSQVNYANSTYNKIGYTTNYKMAPNSSYLNTGKYSNGRRYMESDVIYLSGHGDDEGKTIQLGNNVGYRVDSYYNNNLLKLSSVNWSKVKLITYAGCKTSYNPIQDYSNISVETYRKGAKNVVGFQQEVYTSSLIEWMKKYHDKLKSGGTVVQAIQYANNYSYNDSRVKDIGFFGPSNTTISSVDNTIYSSNLLNTDNQNTTIVTNSIEFTNDNEDLENILTYLESKYSEFNKNDYEVKVYTLNKEQNCYSIDLIKKIGDYYTNLGYSIGVENGKVTSVTDNNDKLTLETKMKIYNKKVSKELLESYKEQAIAQVYKKAIKNELPIKVDKNDITIDNQKCQLFFDTNNNKKYYKVFTTYKNGKGLINVDYKCIEL